MGLLRKATISALRGTGNLLAVHVVPDTLIPSWKTQKRLTTGAGYLVRPFSSSKKKKTSAKNKKRPSSPRSGSPTSARPPATRPAFNKNSWSRGGSLAPAPGFAPSRPTSSPPGSVGRSFSRFKQQAKDFRNEPRLVIQMTMDELLHAPQKKVQAMKREAIAKRDAAQYRLDSFRNSVKSYRPFSRKLKHPN